jgi:hypothetical protein
MSNLEHFLRPSEIIDFEDDAVLAVSSELAENSSGEVETAQRCFEFVRDDILHCVDHDMNPVTCRASEVLFSKTGFCYAKSHLLTALLRANGIPSGLCYQRMIFDESESGYCLHGFVGVYLDDYGWYRIDPRGNKPGIDAQFCPPVEKLAFPCEKPGEIIFPHIMTEPLPELVGFLNSYSDYRDAFRNIIDVKEINCSEEFVLFESGK